MFLLDNEGTVSGSNEEIQKEEKKVNAPDRITVSFSKDAAEPIAEFLSKTGNDSNRSKYIESLLLKEMRWYEEKQRAKERIYEYAAKYNAIFSFGLNDQGEMDVKECQYVEGYSDEAHYEIIKFEEMAGGNYFTRSERVEILTKLLQMSTYDDGEKYTFLDELPF